MHLFCLLLIALMQLWWPIILQTNTLTNCSCKDDLSTSIVNCNEHRWCSPSNKIFIHMQCLTMYYYSKVDKDRCVTDKFLFLQCIPCFAVLYWQNETLGSCCISSFICIYNAQVYGSIVSCFVIWWVSLLVQLELLAELNSWTPFRVFSGASCPA